MRVRTLFLSLLLACPAAAAAQSAPATAADSALALCLAGAAPGAPPSLDRAAANDRAEQLWRAAVAAQPEQTAPRVGLARVLVQCRMSMATAPADMMGLFQEGTGLLRAALQSDPSSWSARLTLGLVYAGSPDFLGLTGAAIEQLERAVGPGGIPEGRPELAEALNALAVQYAKAGRATDAEAARRRAALLAPATPAPSEPARQPESGATLSAITVTTSRTAGSPAGNREGRAVTMLDVVTMPGGAADLMQVLQVLPGVTGGSESSDLSLRGGDPYEAPVLVNGSRLVYAGTFELLDGALFGVVDPEVLRGVRVLPGAFSARYGDALSGVITAETVSRPAARSRRYGVSTAGAATTLMTPVGAGGGAWFSGRLTNTEVLLRMHGRRDEFAAAPLAVAATAGLSRRTGNRETQAVVLAEYDAASPYLTVSAHSGEYHSTGSTIAGATNTTLNRVGPLSTLRLAGSLSTRLTSARFGVMDFDRRVLRTGLRADGDIVLGAAAVITGGLEWARIAELLDGTVPSGTSLAPGSPSRTIDDVERLAYHAGGFLEAAILPFVGFVIRPGLRADRLPGEHSITLDPRIAADLTAGNYLFTVAGGVFHQGRFRPTRERPASDERTGVARQAVHAVVGVERRGPVTVRADLHVKRYGQWTDGDSAFQPVRGTVTGSDVFVNVPGINRSAHFTWSTMRGRLTLPDGSTQRTPYDVSHSLVAVAAQRFAVSWDLGLTLRLATGRPYTAQRTAQGSSTPVAGPSMAERYPAYRRIDARLTRYIRSGSRLVVAYAEMLNLEGRGNVLVYGVEDDAGRRGAPVTTFYGHRTVILGVELR